MKLNDLIKQLNALKKVHGGDLNCDLMNGVTSNLTAINSLNLVYPLDRNACYDRTKPPCGVWISDHKNLKRV